LLIQMMITMILVHPKRFLIFRRGFCHLGVMNFLRGMCVLLTTLPDANPICREQFFNEDGAYKKLSVKDFLYRSFPRALYVILDPATNITCGDMVFSGHTVLFCMVMFGFWQYCVPGQEKNNHVGTMEFWACLISRWVVYVLFTWCLCLIILSKLHYTLDVFIALFLSFFVWTSYHHACEIAELRKSYSWIRWMEEEVTLEVDARAYATTLRKQEQIPGLLERCRGGKQKDS